MEFPRAERKLPCSTVWKFFSVSGPPPPIVNPPWVLNAVATSPSPEEKVMKQAEAGKMAVDKCLANVRDIAETIAKCNTQAMETVSNRMNEGMDELRGIIKSGRAA